jgi:hypothetical protein
MVAMAQKQDCIATRLAIVARKNRRRSDSLGAEPILHRFLAQAIHNHHANDDLQSFACDGEDSQIRDGTRHCRHRQRNPNRRHEYRDPAAPPPTIPQRHRQQNHERSVEQESDGSELLQASAHQEGPCGQRNNLGHAQRGKGKRSTSGDGTQRSDYSHSRWALTAKCRYEAWHRIMLLHPERCHGCKERVLRLAKHPLVRAQSCNNLAYDHRLSLFDSNRIRRLAMGGDLA